MSRDATLRNVRVRVQQRGQKRAERRAVMTLNGMPIYAVRPRQKPVTEDDLLRLATFVTTSGDVARAWMERPNLGLKNLMPRQAVEKGLGQRAADILRSFVTL